MGADRPGFLVPRVVVGLVRKGGEVTTAADGTAGCGQGDGAAYRLARLMMAAVGRLPGGVMRSVVSRVSEGRNTRDVRRGPFGWWVGS